MNRHRLLQSAAYDSLYPFDHPKVREIMEKRIKEGLYQGPSSNSEKANAIYDLMNENKLLEEKKNNIITSLTFLMNMIEGLNVEEYLKKVKTNKVKQHIIWHIKKHKLIDPLEDIVDVRKKTKYNVNDIKKITDELKRILLITNEDIKKKKVK